MLRGSKATTETRLKQSIAKLGKKRLPFSEGTKKKMAMAALRRAPMPKEVVERRRNSLKRFYANGGHPHNKRYFDPTEAKRHRSWTSNRRNRKKRELVISGLSHTFGEWELLKKQYNYTCPACGRSEPDIKLTEDHIIPLSKGGTDIIDNIQPLCLSCNCHKHTRTVKYPI